MTKILMNRLTKERVKIKARWISGEAVPSIAKDYGTVTRNIYYHLGELSIEEKAMHAKNRELRKLLIKQKKQERKEVLKNGTTTNQGGSLADFIKG